MDNTFHTYCKIQDDINVFWPIMIVLGNGHLSMSSRDELQVRLEHRVFAQQQILWGDCGKFECLRETRLTLYKAAYTAPV